MKPDERRSDGAAKPEELAGVAEAITDGTRVDWGRIGDSRGLSGLKLIEQLGQAYAEETVVQGVSPVTSAPVFEPGERLGPYRIDGELGRGGMGVVYLARDLRLDREVAVKALPAGLASDPHALERLTHEARVLASLDHPGIAVIHGMEETADGARFLVLERVRGATLGARLRAGGMPVAEALNVATQIAEALQVAHESGVIHRDLKPGNVMLTASGRVKVLDFGLARAGASGTRGLEPSSAPGGDVAGPGESTVEGTAGYVSPERLHGVADARADVFAFGAVLYECLTGLPAFAGGSSEDVLAAVLSRDPDLTRLPEETPEPIRQLIAASLEKDPDRRLATMDSVLAFLRRGRSAGPAGSRPPSSTPIPRLARSHNDPDCARTERKGHKPERCRPSAIGTGKSTLNESPRSATHPCCDSDNSEK